MRIDKCFKPIGTLLCGMATLAVVEMVLPKVASAIVSVGDKAKKVLGVKR